MEVRIEVLHFAVNRGAGSEVLDDPNQFVSVIPLALGKQQKISRP
jgi:hypothetical protein